MWDLNPAQTQPEPVHIEEEIVIGVDTRSPVNTADIVEKGKYRAILRLQCFFQTKDMTTKLCQGTGWLLRPDILITAAHCTFRHSMGRASRVKAFLGYGADMPNFQLREAVRIGVLSPWLLSHNNRPWDFSVAKLETPFDVAKGEIFSVAATPHSGEEILGVVGYPSDRRSSGEPGGQMYEAWEHTSWDLKKWGNMVSHRVPTFAGQSGSPLLRLNPIEAIGVHTYGSSLGNFACPISPNILNAFADVVRNHPSPLSNKNGIDRVRVDIPETVYPDVNSESVPPIAIENNLDGLNSEAKVDRDKSGIPQIVVPKAEILNNPPNPLYGINYVIIDIPGTVYPLSEVDSIPPTLVDDNLDSPYLAEPTAKVDQDSVKLSPENGIPPIVVPKAVHTLQPNDQ